MKVSIIIPVFNSEKYLEECIDSVIHQTYDDIEVILVNDGSTDNSLSICKEKSVQDNRIMVIEQENKGSASARKNGIINSSGDYIAFVDSDDYIVSNYIETLLYEMSDHDLVTSGYVYGNKTIFDGIEAGAYSFDDSSYVVRNMIYSENNFSSGILTNMCCKLFRSCIAKKTICEIDENIYYGEDAEFVYKYILKCESVNVTRYCGYFYRINNQSVSHTCHDDFLMNVNKLYISLKSCFERSKYKDILIPQLEKWIIMHIRMSVKVMGFNYGESIRYIIPCKKQISGKRIVVYGAGVVGKDYIRQIKKEYLCEDFLWVDKNFNEKESYMGERIVSPQFIDGYNYDYILLAVNNKEVALTIIDELIKQNVMSDKIIETKPLFIDQFYL